MKKLRKRVIEICYKHKNGHLGSSLSCLPIIENIYKKFNFKKDVFILSKGHGCPALFAMLESKGFKPDLNQGHPEIDIKNGVSCTTGSLGHGLPVAVGMAMAKSLKKEKGTIHVLLGDGECQEGTTWESLLIGHHYLLNNLAVHIDNNMNQARGKTIYPSVYMLRKLFPINVYHGIKEFPHIYTLTEKEYKEMIK